MVQPNFQSRFFAGVTLFAIIVLFIGVTTTYPSQGTLQLKAAWIGAITMFLLFYVYWATRVFQRLDHEY